MECLPANLDFCTRTTWDQTVSLAAGDVVYEAVCESSPLQQLVRFLSAFDVVRWGTQYAMHAKVVNTVLAIG